MTYSKQDAEAAISRARSNETERSAIVAEAQLRALAEISEQLGVLNKAFSKKGILGELIVQLQGLALGRNRRAPNG